MSFETEQLLAFKSKAENLKSKNADLYDKSAAAFKTNLRLAFAAALGKIFLAKAGHVLIDCAFHESENVIDGCLLKAQDAWSEKINANLVANWQDQKESLVKEAAGVNSVEVKLREIAVVERSKIRAIAVFEGCYNATPEADLIYCVGKANAECVSRSCHENLELVSTQRAVERCEAQATADFISSSELASNWWILDRTGAWQGQDELMDYVSSSFLKGPCSARNSSKAFDTRDQTLKNMAKVSQQRADFVAVITLIAFVVSIASLVTIIVSHYYFRGKRGLDREVQSIKVSCWWTYQIV